MSKYNTNKNLMVICANLARRKDRRFVLEQNIGHVAGVSVDYLEAIDGKSISEWKMSSKPDGVTPANYAVRLTKRIALRRFLRSQKTHLLFLEDDVVFAEDFEKVLKKSIQLDTDLVFLGGNHVDEPIEQGEWLKCVKIVDNHAVIFSKKGAKKALKVLSDWSYPESDTELSHAIEEGRLKALAPSEMVAFQRESSSDNYGNPGSVSLAEIAIPYMLPDDLAILDSALNNAKRVVEYGSGGSTLHMASRLKGWGELLSIEHSKEWYEQVNGSLLENDLDAKLILREPFPSRQGDGPIRFLPGQFDAYVHAPTDFFTEGSVDLILVDGRQRMRCALASAKLLRKGGLLMIHDFWPRFRYRVFLPQLLVEFEYLLESPPMENNKEQGMAVFRKK